MALITRKKKKLIALALLAISFAVVIVYWHQDSKMEKQREPYLKLSELPTEFVQNCQKAAKAFGMPWELLAAIFQVQLEHDMIDKYPEVGEIIKVATRMAPASGQVNMTEYIKLLGFSEETAAAIETRANRLQSGSQLFSNQYGFPYKPNAKVWYMDTWGADRQEGRVHEGTDIFCAEGTPIYSVSEGKIERLGWNRLGGERVGVRGEDGIYYYYAHMSKINPKLKVEDKVQKGTLLGYTGHTGDAITTPNHLHFGMEAPGGFWINPYYFLRYWQ